MMNKKTAHRCCPKQAKTVILDHCCYSTAKFSRSIFCGCSPAANHNKLSSHPLSTNLPHPGSFSPKLDSTYPPILLTIVYRFQVLSTTAHFSLSLHR